MLPSQTFVYIYANWIYSAYGWKLASAGIQYFEDPLTWYVVHGKKKSKGEKCQRKKRRQNKKHIQNEFLWCVDATAANSHQPKMIRSLYTLHVCRTYRSAKRALLLLHIIILWRRYVCGFYQRACMASFMLFVMYRVYAMHELKHNEHTIIAASPSAYILIFVYKFYCILYYIVYLVSLHFIHNMLYRTYALPRVNIVIGKYMLEYNFVIIFFCLASIADMARFMWMWTWSTPRRSHMCECTWILFVSMILTHLSVCLVLQYTVQYIFSTYTKYTYLCYVLRYFHFVPFHSIIIIISKCSFDFEILLHIIVERHHVQCRIASHCVHTLYANTECIDI